MNYLYQNAKVYCGTYAKYNNGSIQGAWLDLFDYSDADEFFDDCRELHKDEDDPEFMFQDYEGFPSSLYEESMGHELAEKLIELINTPTNIDEEQFEAYLEACGKDLYDGDVYDLIKEAEENLVWHGDESDYAYEFIDEHYGDLPSIISNHIDYEQLGRELLEDYNSSGDYYFYN
ncbi:MAG: antirestriction protein ArdA [Paludibacteraceae bacterium]|nr:antirestriction protein ArdA [Paludibacteraceae bacterium]